MDLVDRLLHHDAWTTRQLLEVCRPLDREQLDRRFEIGPGSVHDTFVEIIGTMAQWADRIGGRPRQTIDGTRSCTISDLVEQLDSNAAALHDAARRVVDEGRAHELMQVTYDGVEYSFTRGTAIVHAATHGMHHRAQIINMLRRLGVEHGVEGDAITWEVEAAEAPGSAISVEEQTGRAP